MQRRQFIQGSLVAGVSCAAVGARAIGSTDDESQVIAETQTKPPYKLTRQTPARRFDGTSFWCHPRAGIVPGAGATASPASSSR